MKAFMQNTPLNIVFQLCLWGNSPASLSSAALNDIFHPSVEGEWITTKY